MPTTCPCPPVRDLQRLVRGQVPDEGAGPLRAHLEECERCLEILRTFEDEPPPAGPRDTPPKGTHSSKTWPSGR
jgi:hypothetical protein